MSNAAVKIGHVSKEFKLPHERNTSIKGALINLIHTGKRNRSYERQQVLNDVSFEIKEGEFFGIVGRNGSGKSTLLKMLAGIYTPTKGEIQVNGKLTPFIELGVGFNPELTGRENVFLNGALLGFNRKEMAVMYDDIVAFAELDKFMDQKLKNYSSGMQVRLAFSIAIRVQGDILLLDEVLAVGDENFQAKCLNYFQTLKEEHKTVVFVSHDMTQVKRFCDKAALIEQGKLVKVDIPEVIADMYRESNLEGALNSAKTGRDKNGTLTVICNDKLAFGETLKVTIDWTKSLDRTAVKNVGISIFKNTGEYVLGINTLLDDVAVRGSSIDCDIVCNLPPALYTVAVGLFGRDDTEVLNYVSDAASFAVQSSEKTKNWQGLVYLNHRWQPKEK